MRRSYESPKWETHMSTHDQYYPPPGNDNVYYFPQTDPYYNNYNYHPQPPPHVSYKEEIIVKEVPHHGRRHNHPEPVKHVRFVEIEKVVEMDRDGLQKEKVVEESIDMEANKFIQQRHKNFARWNTFNM